MQEGIRKTGIHAVYSGGPLAPLAYHHLTLCALSGVPTMAPQNVLPFPRRGVFTDPAIAVNPRYRASLESLLAPNVVPFVPRFDVNKMTDSFVGKSPSASGQDTCPQVYASNLPALVGALHYVLEAAITFHSCGIRTGLTRLRKGYWLLTPRGVLA